MAIIENNLDIKYIQILPAPSEGATENIGEDFRWKTSLILTINVFEIPDYKNIGKLFSKFELLFLD